MKIKPLLAKLGSHSPRMEFSSYEKAAGMLIALGATSLSANADIIYMNYGIGVTSTGDITFPGGDEVGFEIGTQFSSEAYGFVQGINGLLTLASVPLNGFFREADGLQIGNDEDDLFVVQTNHFIIEGQLAANGAEYSSDNYFPFRFTTGEMNSGNPIYGWGRISIPDNDPANARILEWAYESSGASITVGQIPEPTGLSLLALGAAGAAAFHRRRQSTVKP